MSLCGRCCVQFHLALLWERLAYQTQTAMGNEASIEVPGGGSEGYHVLRVQDNSPGQRAGLESFFDFILSVNDHRLVGNSLKPRADRCT